MPWRKKWIDPADFDGTKDELGDVLARRAYEVWVSEIMLQQTRVSTVIPYFKNWISKWPTVQDLAKANHDDVLAAWKGLGYYSRATRLHEGAKAMVAQNSSLPCPIPNTAKELQDYPGIGRYTAGAVSSIAFGVTEPVLDGNVIRVLSRQLGIYADAKDKKINDAYWDVADQLVKSVGKYPEVEKSKVPGMWNQAMMELGSTICTPAPNCEGCPVQNTCRAYAEGVVLAEKKGKLKGEVGDIEDACELCDMLDTEELATAPEEDEENVGEAAPKSNKKRKVEPKKPVNTISQYFAVKTPIVKPDPEPENDENAEIPQTNASKKRKAVNETAKLKSITTYCSLFPKKIPKKKVAEEEAFPQTTVSASNTASRKSSAKKFVDGIEAGDTDLASARYVAELGSLVHVFSHLKLTMHVQHFQLEVGDDEVGQLKVLGAPARKWVATEDMDNETLSTGMRRCWDLIKNEA
ncbi:DNA glycosylase [Massarina eburnea CBS 473.64]|uniref:Adenine DNA glycosylase n=1 Tax=Massarina eburnea CBS 473.64 TaxID=1395130 RepID=A0A6A6RXZ7_9PLEO|nr:DNA glycosylase [Massarina eburnea CBS 473.64]